MEKLFRKYAHWLYHHAHKLKRSVSHHEFFHSKNARLAIILIIATAIPLTVLAVQQVQDIRQQAAPTVTQQCDGSKLLNANPRPAEDGKEIVFSHTDGPITENMFNEEDFTGNGAKECTYDAANGWIKCKAKYNSKSKKEYSEHTWTFRGIQCNYRVNKPAKPTKNPNATPTRRTPKPESTPKPNAGFDADLKADGCNASKIARLKVKWDATSGKICKVTLEGGGQKEERTECDSDDLIYDTLPRGSSNDLKSKTTYKLTVTVDGKTQALSRETADCVKTDRPTPTKTTGGSGTPTPTLRPDQATPGIAAPNDLRASGRCVQDKNGNPHLFISWNKISGVENYIVHDQPKSGSKLSITVGKDTTCYATAVLSGVENTWYIDANKAGSSPQSTPKATITCSKNNTAALSASAFSPAEDKCLKELGQ